MTTHPPPTTRPVPIVGAVRIAAAKRRAIEARLPSVSELKAARAMLLAEYGPCAAAHPELLVATARRLRRDAAWPA